MHTSVVAMDGGANLLANFYLAMTTTLVAGYLRMTAELQPSPKTPGNAYNRERLAAS